VDKEEGYEEEEITESVSDNDDVDEEGEAATRTTQRDGERERMRVSVGINAYPAATLGGGDAFAGETGVSPPSFSAAPGLGSPVPRLTMAFVMLQLVCPQQAYFPSLNVSSNKTGQSS